MYYTYDRVENKYFEFNYIKEDIMETMKKYGRWFIDDPHIITQIRSIHPALRRFIVIEGNNVRVSTQYMRDDVIKQLKFERDGALKALDVLIIKEQELIFAGIGDAEESREKIRGYIADKVVWRDIADHPKLDDIVDLETYVSVRDELFHTLIPNYSEILQSALDDETVTMTIDEF